MIRTQMEIAQEWFQFVDQYWWCPKGIKDLPDLSPSVNTVMEMLYESWDLGDPDRAWSEIERITHKKLQMSNIETSIATKLCGQILLAMQNREGTERLIRDSLISMPRSEKHLVAVLTWMYGIIQWLRPGRHTEAINDWKESVSIFYEISRDPATGMNKKNWYTDQLRIMQDALRKAIREDQLPPLGSVQGVYMPIPLPRVFGGRAPKTDEFDLDVDEFDFDVKAESIEDSKEKLDLHVEDNPIEEPPPQVEDQPSELPKDQEPDISRPELPPEIEKKPERDPQESSPEEEIKDIHKIPLPDLSEEDDHGLIPIDDDIFPVDRSKLSPVVQDFLHSLKVYSKIKAGPPAPIPEQTNDRPVVEIPVVRIEDRYYNIQYLRRRGSGQMVNIFDENVYFLKISGNSMNAAGIEDGDYVVIRYQTQAQNGDIVAALIGDETESEATLKRYSTGKRIGPGNGKNRITLRAESRDPEFRGKQWVFSPDLENHEEGFSIRGVAVAVLKPVEL